MKDEEIIALLRARWPLWEYDPFDIAKFRLGWEARGKDASKALIDVASERERQVSQEGWTHEHDDEHFGGGLARAAGCYALQAGGEYTAARKLWPWEPRWWKPSEPRRNLVKAAALIVAEIERIDRAAAIARAGKG